MKKLFLLAGLFLLPLFAFTQEISTPEPNSADTEVSLYTFDTAKKFDKVKKIVSEAKICIHLPRQQDPVGAGYGCIYDVEEIKQNLKTDNLETFLKDNRIVLAAVIEHIIDKSHNVFHDHYEAFLALGLDPIEAFIRLHNDEDIDKMLGSQKIIYSHWETHESYGVLAAEYSIKEIEVNTTQQEIDEIKNKLEEEKPLIKEFNKEIKKLKWQIRKENGKKFFKHVGKAISTTADEIEEHLSRASYRVGKLLEPLEGGFEGMGRELDHR